MAKSTALGIITAKMVATPIPEGTGKYSRAVDTALPGRHTIKLYNSLKKREAGILSQLRTGMAHLNGYLYTIGATDSDICACGYAKETVKHFLFRCIKWDGLRTQMIRQAGNRGGNLSFHLGGKALTDQNEWIPDLEIVHATIKFAIATGRLKREADYITNGSQSPNNTQQEPTT
jgi:hypothetical protein